MIKTLKLVNFRNYEQKNFDFTGDKTFIVGDNGKGKTNILEALGLISGNSIIDVNYENLLQKGKDFFYIEINGIYSISYDKKSNKKKYIVNSNIVSKKKFMLESFLSVTFSPIVINMMYLSPSLRRDFLDSILIKSHESYDKILKNYKKVVTSRNKVLKNIFEGKSNKDEIFFWNKAFVENAKKVYLYRFKLISYIENNISNFVNVFNGKIKNISLDYTTKVDRNNIESNIEEYIEKNLDRDILLKKTYIGPHIDDFKIIIDSYDLVEFASRGEVKSIVLGLKLLEMLYIEKNTEKKPILLIDDLFSELDDNHKNMLLNRIEDYQTFVTSIKIDMDNYNIITL